MPEVKVIDIPDEIHLAESKRTIASIHRLKGEALGEVMGIVSRLNSRPECFLESHESSPGEGLNILLAHGIARVPHYIIMNEPTNHCKLPAIECMGKSLDECLCGLLLVSHSCPFLD